jgi:hypothetical protein
MKSISRLWLLVAVWTAWFPLADAAWGSGGDSEGRAAPASMLRAETETPDHLLERARVANDELYENLESFVCRERIVRFEGNLEGTKFQPIDLVTARLSFENGVEHYAEIQQNSRARTRISGISGAWSQGEFGTLLRQTERLLLTQPALFNGYAEIGSEQTAVYTMDVPKEESPWELEVEGQDYRIAFHTQVWISTATAHIVKILRDAKTLPDQLHISELSWSVTLAPTNLNGRVWLLPVSGEYAVFYDESDRKEWNVLSFSDYHRYGSEVAVTFGSPEPASGPSK